MAAARWWCTWGAVDTRSTQAGAAPDAFDGFGSDCAGAKYELGAPTAQGAPVLAARRGCGAAQPSLEHGHHLYPLGAELCVPGGHHGLVLQTGAELAYQQQHGGGILRGLLGGCLARVRQA